MEKRDVPYCELCKQKDFHHIHHKDGNHKNNKPSNLQKLCTPCHAKIHGIEPNISELRYRLIQFTKAQKIRISIDNAVRGYLRIEMEAPVEIQVLQDTAEKIEKIKEKVLVFFFKENPSFLHAWMVSIKGIGDVLASKFLASIDFTKTPTEASLWAYAGLTPDSKKTKGKKANWNQDLKSYCYQLSDSFIKQRTPKYREIYDKYKEKQLAAGLKRGHADSRARRKAVKVFLRDLFKKAKE